MQKPVAQAYEVMKAALAGLDAVDLPILPTADDFQHQAAHVQEVMAIVNAYMNAIGSDLSRSTSCPVNVDSFEIEADGPQGQYERVADYADYHSGATF